MTALRVGRDGHVLRVTLARAERSNALDAALIDELTGASVDVGDARAVALRGAGPSFSAGADVGWMRSSIDLSHDQNVADALRLRTMLDTINGCPLPVLAAVQGHALGGAPGDPRRRPRGGKSGEATRPYSPLGCGDGTTDRPTPHGGRGTGTPPRVP